LIKDLPQEVFVKSGEVVRMPVATVLGGKIDVVAVIS